MKAPSMAVVVVSAVFTTALVGSYGVPAPILLLLVAVFGIGFAMARRADG